MIKVDLHMHSGEDPEDGLRYPATALIDRAAGDVALKDLRSGEQDRVPRAEAAARTSSASDRVRTASSA